jgi:hypothetical protein
MGNGGFKFLSLPFHYLVAWGFINMAISVNLFHWMHVANLQCGSSRFAIYRKQGFSIRPRFSYAKSVESELIAIR